MKRLINKRITPLKKNLPVSEKLQSIYLDHFKPVYLIFDQFEELFILGSDDEKTGFIKLIKEVVESDTQCHVIFSIREEFLAGITEFEYDLPEIFSNRFRVEKMKRANAILAIEGPCKVNSIETETGFSEELIDKLCPAGKEIELTFMQIYLDRVFRIAVAERDKNLITYSFLKKCSPGQVVSPIYWDNFLRSRSGNWRILIQVWQFLNLLSRYRVQKDR